MKAGGLTMLVSAAIFALAGLVQINPVWLYGPYTPFQVSEGAQPDWYLGFLDGSVRLWPHWEFRSFGHEIPNPFFPGLLIPGLVFTIMYAWPWIDKKIYNDYGPHNLLDRPRDKPFRTGVGVAAIIFFSVLTIACADDILSADFHIPFERMIEILQYSVLIGPVVGFIIAYKACQALARTHAHPIQRPIGGIIVRTPDGAYHTLAEMHGNGHGPHPAMENGHADDRVAGAAVEGDGGGAAAESAGAGAGAGAGDGEGDGGAGRAAPVGEPTTSAD
jgi:ubiquinol-cytochrome c reductase cytochrome b subunit